MFDSLLNSKFYNKCKHAVKCTRTRLDLLRRKKRAMLKFLEEDVADLLVNGLESHAFGRMDGLIFEMNQASCYDTLELYCEFIVKRLNNLQKESECPQEALEAVSTLIFAAARFHDLPELCDLRHTFTEKYGSSVESFVSREFVQKLQNKSFTNEEKLQVMKSVAEEFSVPFDGRALEWKITCGPGHNKHDLEKKGSHRRVDAEASVQNGQKIGRHAMHERKHKATAPEGYEQQQEIMKVKPKDIHVVTDGIGQMGEETRKNHSEKLRPVSVRTKNAKPPSSTHRADARDRTAGNDDEKTSTDRRTPDDINDARDFRRILPSGEGRRKRRTVGVEDRESGGEEEDDEADNTAIDFGNLLRPRPRAGAGAGGPRSSWQRKHRSRSADPGRDDEERMMDKLLMHYSKKGLLDVREEHDGKRVNKQSRIPRPRPRGADHHHHHHHPAARDDGVVVRENSNNDASAGRARAHRRPVDRAASLPAEPAASPKAKPEKAPVRSVSMQPACRGDNVHPKLPDDFDQLAERIRALNNDDV